MMTSNNIQQKFNIKFVWGEYKHNSSLENAGTKEQSRYFHENLFSF